MNLQTFFQSFNACLRDNNIICFTQKASSSTTESAYPILFFSMLNNKIKTVTDQLLHININEIESDALISQLSVSFLGLTTVYWLTAFHELDAKKKSKWISYLVSYQGPHRVIFFAEDVDIKGSENRVIVELPEAIDLQEYQNLLAFFKPDIKTKHFATSLFTARPTVSLDTACLMLEYHLVAGAGSDAFINDWLNKIVVSEKSLFTLSQHLFAKSTKSFFLLWKDIGPEYPEMFWTSYWSEQLWRAYYFVKMCKSKDMVQAKKIAYRLPFSFIQRDWRKVSLEELRNAHQALYDFDFNFKNGSSTDALELIFHKFLLGEFKKEKSQG